MRRGSGLFLLVLGFLIAGTFGCAEPEKRTPAPSTPPSAGEAFRGDGSTLEILEIQPQPGTEVNGDTILRARLRYSIGGHFVPGLHIIIAQFATSEANRSFDGDYPNEDYPQPKAARGEATLEFPIGYVFHSPRAAFPIRVRFLLLRRRSVQWMGGVSDATTDVVQFAATPPPARATGSAK